MRCFNGEFDSQERSPLERVRQGGPYGILPNLNLALNPNRLPNLNPTLNLSPHLAMQEE
jgi:hypothetical protein